MFTKIRQWKCDTLGMSGDTRVIKKALPKNLSAHVSGPNARGVVRFFSKTQTSTRTTKEWSARSLLTSVE